MEWIDRSIQIPNLEEYNIDKLVRRQGIQPAAWNALYERYFDQILNQYQIEIYDEAELGKGNISPRQVGILLHYFSEIGAGAALVTTEMLQRREPPYSGRGFVNKKTLRTG